MKMEESRLMENKIKEKSIFLYFVIRIKNHSKKVEEIIYHAFEHDEICQKLVKSTREERQICV